MKLGLLSDSHDRVPAVAEFLRRFNEAGVTLVLHAGDICASFTLAPFRDAKLPLLGVFGRNDGDREGLRGAAAALPAGGELYEPPHSLEVDGKRVLVVHDLSDTLQRSVESHDLIVHGCMHRTDVQRRGDACLVNPGEACGWLTGTPTAAIVDLDTMHVDIVKLTGPEWGN